MPSNRRGLIWVLLGLAVLLMIIAAGAVLVYVLLGERPAAAAPSWQDPIAGIVPDKIAPDLALYPLAGASALETIDTAIDNNELYTAYATLVLSPGLKDTQRSGRLLELADRSREAGDEDMAGLIYQQVYDLAILSPEMNDPLRADALLGSGKGWAALDRQDQAAVAYDQVYVIALNSPYLQTAQRRQLLDSLATACTDIGRTEQATQCRQQIAALDQRPRSQPPAMAEDPVGLFISQEPVSNEEIGRLEESRRQAAYAVLQTLAAGRQSDQAQLGTLSQALQAEDGSKTAFYQQELAAATQLGKRVTIHQAVLRWLMLKAQVAARGFGLSIVPEWEGQKAAIQSELSKAYEALRFDYEDMVTSLPDASLMEPGRYEVWRWLALAGRLGQYPNYPEGQTAAKLQESARKLIDGGVTAPLYVDVRTEGQAVHFFLNPAPIYGQTAAP